MEEHKADELFDTVWRESLIGSMWGDTSDIPKNAWWREWLVRRLEHWSWRFEGWAGRLDLRQQQISQRVAARWLPDVDWNEVGDTIHIPKISALTTKRD